MDSWISLQYIPDSYYSLRCLSLSALGCYVIEETVRLMLMLGAYEHWQPYLAHLHKD